VLDGGEAVTARAVLEASRLVLPAPLVAPHLRAALTAMENAARLFRGLAAAKRADKQLQLYGWWCRTNESAALARFLRLQERFSELHRVADTAAAVAAAAVTTAALRRGGSLRFIDACNEDIGENSLSPSALCSPSAAGALAKRLRQSPTRSMDIARARRGPRRPNARREPRHMGGSRARLRDLRKKAAFDV